MSKKVTLITVQAVAKVGKGKDKKKRKKKDKSNSTIDSNSDEEETEEQQETRQCRMKWEKELQPLRDYQESHNIFSELVLPRSDSNHMAYLGTCLMEADSDFFFIQTFANLRDELQKQSTAPGFTGISARHKQQTLNTKEWLVMSHANGIKAGYLVEVFKYPSTGDCFPPDAADSYGMQQMLGVYGLVQPYSITRITTTQSSITKDSKKKSTMKCYCTLCDYIVQNHPSVNNHMRTHLWLSLLCTIDGCFTIKHDCTDMWNHTNHEHGISASQLAVKMKGRCKKYTFHHPNASGIWHHACVKFHRPSRLTLQTAVPWMYCSVPDVFSCVKHILNQD